jgi:fructose-1,6-bisphosphatase I
MSGGSPVIEDVMQPGRQMVAAGYALYGACTVLFLSLGSGVHGFTLDPALNEFILTHENIRIPYCGHIYSVNEGYSSLWKPEIRELISRFKVCCDKIHCVEYFFYLILFRRKFP